MTSSNDQHDLDSELNFQHLYPDPVRTSDHPYPALSQNIYDPLQHPATGAPAAASGYLDGASFGVLTNSHSALAEQFHLVQGNLGQLSIPNWHFETGEQLRYDDPDDDANGSSDTTENEEPDWREGARIARDRQDAEDADFQPDDIPVDALLDELDFVGDGEDDDDDGDGDDDDDDENSIGEELNRSVRGGRGRGRGGRKRGSGTTRRGWRQILKGSGFENIGRVEKPKVGRPRGGSRRGRQRKKVDPGYKFKDMLNLATQAHLTGNLDVAADYCRQAIQINPELFEAHSLLSEIMKQQGRLSDSALALQNGAHTVRKPQMWINVAERFLGAAEQEDDEEYMRSAINCYSEALKLKGHFDRDLEFELRERRFCVFKELKDSKLARAECRYMLRIRPEDIAVCREYAQLCADLNDKSEYIKVKAAYDSAFEQVDSDDVLANSDDYWSHLNVYLEILDMIGNPLDGIFKLKQLSRWILGRGAEVFWDRYVDDDREFDNDAERRSLVTEFLSGMASPDKFKYGAGLPIDIRVRLGIFRLELGDVHYDEGLRHLQPLFAHLDEPEDYHDLFVQAATALRASGGRNAISYSLDLYDALRTLPELIDEQTWMFMADCFRCLEKRVDAIECYEEAVNFRGKSYPVASAHLAKLYDSIGEKDKARYLCTEVIKLGRVDLLDDDQLKMFPESQRARLGHRERNTKAMGGGARRRWRFGNFDQGDEADEAQTETDQTSRKRKREIGRYPELSNEDDQDGDEDQGSETPGAKRQRVQSLYAKRYSQVAHQRLQQIEDVNARVHANYNKVKVNWAALLRGDDKEATRQWVEGATSMVEDFANMKVFFPERDRNVKLRLGEDGLYSKLPPKAYVPGHYEPPQDFHSIPFSEWHHVFSDLALIYARRGEQDRCYKILQDILFSANVFYHSPQLDLANYGMAICCASIFNDCQYLIDLARKLIQKTDFASPAFSLFAAVNHLSFGSTWFNAGPSQKFMLRMVKQLDFTALPEQALHKFDWSIHKPALERRRKDIQASQDPSSAGPVPPASLLDAGVLLMYGHMVGVANHSNSAVPYYFRAFALAPESPCVHLSLAAMWVQNAMKRQTDNRHFTIAQGLAYLDSYRDLRTKAESPIVLKQEAEFNSGRMWHHLGLTHLAVPFYERVVNMSAQVREEWNREKADDGEEEGEDGEGEDFALEAAFALQTLYALAGNDVSARRIGEDWLVL